MSEDDMSFLNQEKEVIPRDEEYVRREEFRQRAESNQQKRTTSNYVPEKEGKCRGEGGWVSQQTSYTMENLVQYHNRDYIKEMLGSLWDERDAGRNLGEKRLVTANERYGTKEGMNLKGLASLSSENYDMEDETVGTLVGLSADKHKAERAGVRIIPMGVSKLWMFQAIHWPNKITIDGEEVENWKGASFTRLYDDNPWKLAKTKSNKAKSRLIVLTMPDTFHFVTIVCEYEKCEDGGVILHVVDMDSLRGEAPGEKVTRFMTWLAELLSDCLTTVSYTHLTLPTILLV